MSFEYIDLSRLSCYGSIEETEAVGDSLLLIKAGNNYWDLLQS